MGTALGMVVWCACVEDVLCEVPMCAVEPGGNAVDSGGWVDYLDGDVSGEVRDLDGEKRYSLITS